MIWLYLFLSLSPFALADTCALHVKSTAALLRKQNTEKTKFAAAEKAVFACAQEAQKRGREPVRVLLRRAVIGCEQIDANRSLTANTDCYFRAAHAAAGLLKP